MGAISLADIAGQRLLCREETSKSTRSFCENSSMPTVRSVFASVNNSLATNAVQVDLNQGLAV